MIIRFLHMAGVRSVANDNPLLALASRGLVANNRGVICVASCSIDDT